MTQKLTKAQTTFLREAIGEGKMARANNSTVLALRARNLIERSPRAAPVGNWWTITSAGRAALEQG